MTVTDLKFDTAMDEIGSLSFSVSASEGRAQVLYPGVLIRAYDDQDGYLGLYIFRDRNLVVQDERGTFKVTASSVMDELRRVLVGFRREYTDQPFDTILADLLGLVSGWTSIIPVGLGSLSLTFEGESVFNAIAQLCEVGGIHLRQGTERTLEVGPFGDDSNLILTNLRGQVPGLFEVGTQTAFIDQIKEHISGDAIFNQIIPLGSGTGVGQLTIEGAVLGTNPVLSALNDDGSSYFYIQDTASVAQYGARPRIVTFPTIRAISNNDTDIQYARETLKIAAEAYLIRSKDEVREYAVTVQGIPPTLKPGQQVRIRYRGASEEGTFLDVDEMFWVMEIRRSYSSQGERSQQLTLTRTDAKRIQDQEVIVDVVRDLAALKLHIQPQPFWSENTYTESLAGTATPTSRRDAEFVLEIDDSVRDLTKVRLRLRTRPLYTLTWSNIEEVYSPSLSDIKDHYFFAISRASFYPAFLRLSIDGVDVTDDVGGEWGSAGSEQTQIIDITDYIKNASGGMRQTHTITVWSETDISGEARVNTAYFSQTSGINLGLIECNIRVQGISQAIVPG